MEMLIFIAGIIIGVVALAFFILVNNCHREFHEIEWHDAQQEKPSLYVEGTDTEFPFVRVLITTKKRIVIDSTYYPGIDRYDYEEKKNVTHFAYIEEIKRTVPPCPVCSGTVGIDPLNPYAYPGSL